MAKKLSSKDREKRKLEIIDKASKLFRNKGYENVTVDDIAKSVHISKVSIYNYVKSKEDILFQIHDMATEALLGSLKAIIKKDLPPTKMLIEAFTNHLRIVCSEMSFTTAALQEEYALRKSARRKLISKRDEYDRLFRTIIEKGIECGEFVAFNPKLLSFMMIGAANYTPHWYSSKGPLQKEVIIDNFVRFFTRGICTELSNA